MGHLSRNCRSNPMGARAGPAGPAAPAAQTAPVARGAQAAPATAYAPGACFTCGQFGHISRFCPTKGHGAKRQAITPRVYALGEANGAELIAGSVSFGGEVAHTLFDTGASHSFVSSRLAKSWPFRGVFEPKVSRFRQPVLRDWGPLVFIEMYKSYWEESIS
ncbi:DNA-binding protein HEXBP-like [Brassica napus]|uniref:DNA-binding protein HEXBP-like n=1 Tax=Brassica oleracea var. oleracea TaxID=109376 RepID=UPI0006A6D7C2|nr:PREDICTED: DNA-binding protein HEXBP-like [Brassica oleracea var. oleracea]XP_048622687.1 DNA-binding protein HEXBP-like [Brassica napus]